MIVDGTTIDVRVDGAPLFGGPVTDSDLATGSVALYSWGNDGSRFDDVVVTAVGGGNTAPIITSGATASVAENQTSAIDVQATDDHEAEGAGLTYSKTGGADQALFTLEATTGMLTFLTAPDFEAPADAGADNIYNVQVTVTDLGPGTPLTAVQAIAITVTDVAEGGNTAPTITSATTASGAENQTSAIDVDSTDDTDSEGAGLTYNFTSTGVGLGIDNSDFTLDPTTGVVTFTSVPDFETPADANGDNVYLIQVTVTDSGALTAVQAITITVTDVAEGGTLLTDDFADGNFNGWTIIDEGTIEAPSAWAVVNEALAQSSNIYGGNTSAGALPKPGTFAWYTAGLGWSDYQLTAQLQSTDNDALGVMVRYQDRITIIASRGISNGATGGWSKSSMAPSHSWPSRLCPMLAAKPTNST